MVFSNLTGGKKLILNSPSPITGRGGFAPLRMKKGAWRKL
jgi:hypothetical protein